MSQLKVDTITDEAGTGSPSLPNGLTVGGVNYPSTGPLSNRNKIINGAMVIDQRAAGSAATVNGLYASADRWKAGNNTNTGTIQQITSTLSGFRNSIKYTAAGAGTFFQLGQQIEFSNCYDLQNKTVTISFRAKANNANAGSTGLIVRTRTVAGVDGAALFAGTAVGTNITLTTSDAVYTVTRTLPATFGALSLEFALGSHASGDGFELTGVQLEAGTVATPFEHRSFGQELALCQRYFQKSYNTEVAVGTNTGVGVTKWRNDANNAGVFLRATEFLQTRMRATPTYVIYTSGGVSGTINSFDGANATHTVSGLDQPSARGFAGINITGSSVPNSAEYFYQYTASAEL
jgi:hypothetical protein